MKLSKQTIFGFGAGMIFCILLVVLLAAKGNLFQTKSISIPQVLSYQGYLTDKNGVPISGTKSLTFTIYDNDGNPVWNETQDVTFDDGQFSVYLGKEKPIDASIFSNPPISLGIKVDGSDELPRQQLASMAYAMVAFKANDADTVGGRTPDTFADTTHQHAGSDITSAVTSAVDADKVDGKHATDFAASSHTHSGTDITSAVANATNAQQASNADTVDGLHAATTPTPGNLLAMDGNGKLPAGALKVYDSGWFAVTVNTSYTKTHNLGTTRVLCFMYYATDSNGSNMVQLAGCFSSYDNLIEKGGQIQSITTTTCVARTSSRVAHIVGTDPPHGDNGRTSGYYRIIAIALE